ncbi:MAG TPA: hypothetical protein V6C63_06845 [Allocoleopsis sp.]
MERVRQILLERGKAVADSRIQDKLTEYELTGELSETDAKAIADELEGEAQSVSNGLAVSNGNGKAPAPAKAGKGKGRKNAKQVSLQDAIVKAAKETETELTTMESAIRQRKGAYVEARATSIVNEIRNTSTEIVAGVTEKLMQEEADVNSFRDIGEQFGQNLFPAFDFTEAV